MAKLDKFSSTGRQTKHVKWWSAPLCKNQYDMRECLSRLHLVEARSEDVQELTATCSLSQANFFL